MKLHASGEDYLETILVLQKKLGMVRSVDVARHMEVSKPSVCHAVATLRDGGFLTMDEDHFLHLTDVGREVAEKIYERHCFFTEQLIAAGVDPRTAEADACRIEHIISDESFSRLKEAARTGTNLNQISQAILPRKTKEKNRCIQVFCAPKCFSGFCEVFEYIKADFLMPSTKDDARRLTRP